jgi:formate dehydrogenase major subunit
MTNSVAEVVDADVIFLIGSNPTEAHPVMGTQIRQARKRGAKLIVADPRVIDLAKEAAVHLQLTPGTNIALLNGMMHTIITEGLMDKDYVENQTEGFDALWDVVKDYTPEKAGEICGIDPEDLKAAARLYASGRRAPIYYCLGVTEHSSGTAGVMSISNLALLCGNVGKYAAGVNPLRGQNNVQGACDMGAIPAMYSGYQKVADPEVRAKFSQAWGVEMSETTGLTSIEAMNGAVRGDVRGIYIMGENPMLSDPNIAHVEQSLKNLDFLVVQDIFLTETAELADVVLPASCFAEKEGTFTNTERRVQRVRKAVEGPGESREDWAILAEVMRRLGFDPGFGSASEIMDEIARLTPSFGGISHKRLEQEQVQWPCPSSDHPGTPILHVGKFSRGERAMFRPWPYIPAGELPDDEYPMLLSTGRLLYHYNTPTMTGKNEELMEIEGRSFIEINPADADKLGVEQGGRMKVASRRGEIETEARVTERVPEGVLFMPFHFADGPANALTSSVVDPISDTPEYKVCAVKIKRIAQDARVS